MRSALPLLAVLVGCATARDPAAVRRGLDEARAREPYLAMLDEEAAREALPQFGGRRLPHLARVAAYMPDTWSAEMAAWGALGKEGTLDRKLLSEVFYVVSSANDCFY